MQGGARRRSRRSRRSWLAIRVGALILFGAGAAVAAPIQYGSFGPDSPPGIVVYQDVEESSGTDPVPPGRYGPPSLSGDTLDFDPTEFVASATGGGGDITDVQLNFQVSVLEVNDVVAGGLETLFVSESGDFSLFGSGTAATAVTGAISIAIDILEVDGVPIAPISVFASSAVVRDLVSDGPVVLAPWSNGVLIEFGPVLVAHDIDFQFGVTLAEVVIDNQLIALAEAGSAAFIAKKDFAIEPGVVLNPDFVVPEPSTALLLSSALLALGLARRRAG